MNSRTATTVSNTEPGVFFPRLTPMAAIEAFARKVRERFRPERIILFGSYAYGTPTPDSDVDLLVVMSTHNQIEQAVRIDEAIEERAFPLDLMVRTPRTVAQRLRMGDSFMQEIMARGRVLYEKGRKAMAAKGGARSGRCRAPVRARTAPHG